MIKKIFLKLIQDEKYPATKSVRALDNKSVE